MTFARFALVALLAAAAPGAASAEEALPKPKAGLWESSIVSGNVPMMPGSYKQCMDGNIDMQSMMRATGGMCDLQWKRVAEDRIETETSCKMGPISAKGNGVITGDFNAKLRIETTTAVSMENMPAGARAALPNEKTNMVIETHWVGPCEPGQNPGDFIMPDGKVMRIPGMTN
jgi:hypothetical protein